METAREILFILQRPADLPPSRSISVLAWLKQKQMLSFRVAHMSDRDMLRKNHLYGLIPVGMTRKDNPQRWLAVFVRHNQAHPLAFWTAGGACVRSAGAKNKLAKRLN